MTYSSDQLASTAARQPPWYSVEGEGVEVVLIPNHDSAYPPPGMVIPQGLGSWDAGRSGKRSILGLKEL